TSEGPMRRCTERGAGLAGVVMRVRTSWARRGPAPASGAAVALFGWVKVFVPTVSAPSWWCGRGGAGVAGLARRGRAGGPSRSGGAWRVVEPEGVQQEVEVVAVAGLGEGDAGGGDAFLAGGLAAGGDELSVGDGHAAPSCAPQVQRWLMASSSASRLSRARAWSRERASSRVRGVRRPGRPPSA